MFQITSLKETLAVKLAVLENTEQALEQTSDQLLTATLNGEELGKQNGKVGSLLNYNAPLINYLTEYILYIC